MSASSDPVRRFFRDPRLNGPYAPNPGYNQPTVTSMRAGETFDRKQWRPVECPRCGDEFMTLGQWAQHFNPIDRSKRCQVEEKPQ